VTWLLCHPVVTSSPARAARYCDHHVCLLVCLPAHLHNSQTAWPNFTNFMRMLLVAVALSSSDGVAIRYVLPLLQMTSCFHTVRPMGRIKHNVMFRRVRQVAAPAGRQTITVMVEFIRMWQQGKACYLPLHYFKQKPDTHSLRMPDSFCTYLSGNSFSSGSRLIGP